MSGTVTALSIECPFADIKIGAMASLETKDETVQINQRVGPFSDRDRNIADERSQVSVEKGALQKSEGQEKACYCLSEKKLILESQDRRDSDNINSKVYQTKGKQNR